VSGEGRVDRAGYDDESRGQVLPRGMLPGRSPCEIPMAGTCDKERPWGGVSLWDEASGWEVL
jgi:hypothetical protein